MNVDKKQAAYQDFLSGMKYPAIADKYGVSLSTVKSWAKRHWKPPGGATESATGEKNRKTKVAAAKPKIGAPPRNQNAFKTGERAAIWEDQLTDAERGFLQSAMPSPLEQLEEDIRLITIRERRMLEYLADLKRQREKPIAPGEASDLADDVTKIAERRESKGNCSQLVVQRHLLEKILGIEAALTNVQRQRSKMVETRHRLMKEMGAGADGETEIRVYIPDNGRD